MFVGLSVSQRVPEWVSAGETRNNTTQPPVRLLLSPLIHWSMRVAEMTRGRRRPVDRCPLPEVRVAPYWSRSCRATPLVQPKPSYGATRCKTAEREGCFLFLLSIQESSKDVVVKHDKEKHETINLCRWKVDDNKTQQGRKLHKKEDG